MQQSSSSIGNLAAALAKAQVELVNPEKSMVATMPADGKVAAQQIFRYAPLSSGLDIVRKTLGRHQIATVQATAIDHAVGLINVTTTLAHSSGEWISSDWPVCSLEDVASPKRMERRSLTPGATLFSHWLALQAKTISTRRGCRPVRLSGHRRSQKRRRCQIRFAIQPCKEQSNDYQFTRPKPLAPSSPAADRP